MTQPLAEPLNDGTFVRITDATYKWAQIVECLGPFGPRGARVYRLLVSKRPRMYTMALEGQLEVLERSKLAAS